MHARHGVPVLQRPAGSVDRLTGLRHYVGIPVSTIRTPTEAICAVLILSTYQSTLTASSHYLGALTASTYLAGLSGQATYTPTLSLTVCED